MKLKDVLETMWSTYELTVIIRTEANGKTMQRVIEDVTEFDEIETTQGNRFVDSVKIEAENKTVIIYLA